MKHAEFGLNIHGDAFRALRQDFDQSLYCLLNNMENKYAEEGTIAINIGVTLSRETVIDGSTGEEREITKPAFEHTVSSRILLKSKLSGKFRGDYELVWDNGDLSYYAVPVARAQMHIDDYAQEPGGGD